MRRAFTAVELAICLSILAIIVPLVYAGARAVGDTHQLGLWHLQTADEIRTIREELRADARRGLPLPDQPLSWRLGDCTVSYQLDGDVLLRHAPAACGGSRALAVGVEAIEPSDLGVAITFVRILRPTLEQRSTVFIPMEVTP